MSPSERSSPAYQLESHDYARPRRHLHAGALLPRTDTPATKVLFQKAEHHVLAAAEKMRWSFIDPDANVDLLRSL